MTQNTFYKTLSTDHTALNKFCRTRTNPKGLSQNGLTTKGMSQNGLTTCSSMQFPIVNKKIEIL